MCDAGVRSAAWLTDDSIQRLSDYGRELDGRTPAQQAYRRMTLTREVVVTGTVLSRHLYKKTGMDAKLVTWHSCTLSGNLVCGPPKTSATSADILISNTNVEL